MGVLPLAAPSGPTRPQPEVLRTSLLARLALALVPPLAAVVIRLLGATLRYQDLTDPGTIPGAQHPGSSIYVFPHRSLLIAAHRFRNRQIAILISQSFDGELIARTVRRLGFVPVRGSSSRAGVSGLRGLARAYGAGHICAFTVDGPRGPAMIAKPGAAQLAQLTGAPEIGAFYAFPIRCWQLRSWDRFLIPKPFSRVVVAWSARVTRELGANSGPDRIPLSSIQAALDRAVSMAEGVGPFS